MFDYTTTECTFQTFTEHTKEMDTKGWEMISASLSVADWRDFVMVWRRYNT